MPSSLVLHGYRFSVYTWAARFALAERGTVWDDIEVDPFSQPVPHPFNRVPLLTDGDFTLYETRAILRWAAHLPGPGWVPSGVRAEARMEQVLGIADAYAYWPLVRQVFAHAVFRPASGKEADPTVVSEGLAGAAPVLAELDCIAQEGLVLAGPLSLADLLLMPMLDYFARAAAGVEALVARPTLAARLDEISRRPSFGATRPGLPEPPPRAGET